VDSVNPYESPRARGGNLRPRRKSIWEGPLLSLGIISFIFAPFTRMLTVVPEGRWMQVAVVVTLAGIGALCIILSFQLHRQARR
jgi:hypothetical protein